MNDNEVILYEITDKPVDSSVQEPINDEETRPRISPRASIMLIKGVSMKQDLSYMHLTAFMTVLVRILVFKKSGSH